MTQIKEITIKTQKQFILLDDYINDFLKDKKGDGLINVFVAHSTCGLKVIEKEILLLSDISAFLSEFFPKDGDYRHDNIDVRPDCPPDERLNGFSHMRQLFFSSDVTVPVRDGKMLLGQYQGVYLVELDPVRERTVYISWVGVDSEPALQI